MTPTILTTTMDHRHNECTGVFNRDLSDCGEESRSQLKSSSRRKRSFFLVTPEGNALTVSPGSHSSSHLRGQFPSELPSDWQLHQPDLTSVSQLLAALLLTTALTVLSALDAMHHCLQHEAYALLDLVDDDNFQQAYENAISNEGGKCRRMFQNVLVPTGAVTFSLGGVCLVLIYCHSRRGGTCAYATIRVTVKLLLLLLAMFAIQTYSIMAIMLQTRNYSANSSDNPYEHLAAVDHYGHVADNANLYYMAWISEILAISLVYQTVAATIRLTRAAKNQADSALLPATSWDSSYRMDSESRAMWYKSLYRLRIRTGIWMAAFLSSFVVIASSQYVWTQVLWAYASQYSADAKYTTVCRVVRENSNLPPQLCRRTVTSWLSGVIGSALSATAIGMHLAGRWTAADSQLHQQDSLPVWERLLVQNRLPLRTELVLSVLLSIVSGFNAVFATGVQGPAATVGNLYYASWLCFLLYVRIGLGCLEEHHNIEEEEVGEDIKQDGYIAPVLVGRQVGVTSARDMSTLQSSSDATGKSEQVYTDPLEKDRAPIARKYFFLAIFSLVCAASAYDAASNQNKRLTPVQIYMSTAPCVVSVLSGFLFVLCLSPHCYTIVSRFWIGGSLSIFCFIVWLVNLVLTMHSANSWAVNGIGEIKTANLYYFSWASIITSSIQMMSYLKAAFGVKKNDYMSFVWVGICKVCFVVLGAAMHIWHTISGNCGFDEITIGAVTFCSRTVLAMVVALTGMLVGGLVVAGRMLLMCCPSCQCSRFQTHIEMIISIFLVFLFGAAVALITGIGGPGQSVGDLYYSTWCAFLISIGIFVSCFEQIKLEDMELDSSQQKQLERRKATDNVLV